MQSGCPFNVLVVDDHVDGADALADYFVALGWMVERAYSGAQALAIAGRCRPDVVVVDINMPAMDGYETARLLRETCAGSLRIVGYTGSAVSQVLKLTGDAEFDCIVSRGAAMELLVAAVTGYGRLPTSANR